MTVVFEEEDFKSNQIKEFVAQHTPRWLSHTLWLTELVLRGVHRCKKVAIRIYTK